MQWLTKANINRKEWVEVWSELWEEPRDVSHVAGLIELGEQWLQNVRPNHDRWVAVWKILWEHSRNDDSLRQRLVSLGEFWKLKMPINNPQRAEFDMILTG